MGERLISIDQAFGQVIRRRRLACDMSQERLAEVCDLHRTYIGQLERGEKSASLGVIDSIASALGLTLPELFSEVDNTRRRDT